MKKAFLLFFLIPLQLLAWYDTSHMAIVQIAYERLSPEVRDKVDAISSSFSDPFPESNTFVTSACWMDDLGRSLKAFSSWHHSSLPYDPEGVLSIEACETLVANLEGKDALFALEESMKTLKNPEAHPFAKWLMLRILVHVAADIHQPIHCATLYNETFPDGDMGGNKFLINHSIGNLHALWDSGCRLTTEKLPRPLDTRGQAIVKALADQAAAAFPENLFPCLDSQDFAAWREESFCIAQDAVYRGIQPGQTPSDDYLKKGQQVCLMRIAEAGYRLSYLLNDAFK